MEDLKGALAQILPVVVGALVLFVAQKLGLVKPPPPKPVDPNAPAPVTPVPATPAGPVDRLLAPLDYLLKHPLLGPVVKPLVEQFVAWLQEKILPLKEGPAPFQQFVEHTDKNKVVLP